MDIFLVPVGPAQYELYSEQADAGLAGEADGPQSGVIARARQGFAEMLLAAADRERARRDGSWEEPAGRWARIRDRLTAWVAERVAEQQLHWSLRRIEAAALVHPSSLSSDDAMKAVRASLAYDRKRHGRWAVVHGVLFVIGGVLAVIPGPNLVAYYFAFRMIGHWLSMRGASQGLSRVRWAPRASDELTAVAEALGDAPTVRHAKLADAAGRLGLEDLPAFVERVRLRRA
ncbi:MAG: hypothetical protein AB7I25_14360 [Vicinamibacterales bacterium]